jgi:hypothetical protein
MKVFKKSSIVKEQEIYACMLHGLFDEYRFLHKYPPQFLEKIAKLFGAVIKNKFLTSFCRTSRSSLSVTPSEGMVSAKTSVSSSSETSSTS